METCLVGAPAQPRRDGGIFGAVLLMGHVVVADFVRQWLAGVGTRHDEIDHVQALVPAEGAAGRAGSAQESHVVVFHGGQGRATAAQAVATHARAACCCRRAGNTG